MLSRLGITCSEPDSYSDLMVTSSPTRTSRSSQTLRTLISVEAWQQSLRNDLVSAVKSGAAFTAIEEGLHRRLTDEEKLEIVKQGFQIKPTQPTIKVFLANGKGYDADLLDYSPPISEPNGKDVAILKIPADDLPTVQLGDSDAVRVQDSVLLIGYRGTDSGIASAVRFGSESGLLPTATKGRISAIKVLSSGSPILQADMAITLGSGGAPVFNEQGQVIGIAAAGLEATQGFSFLVPLDAAKEFVRREGVAPENGTFTRHWKRALDLFDERKCRSAISEFNEVLQIMPGLPDAMRLRALALECADNKPAPEQTESEAIAGTESESAREHRGFTVSPGVKPGFTRGQTGPYVALVIGINNYRSLPKLRTAVNDAEQVAATLHDLYGFDIQLLRNAGRHEILKALADYRRNLDENTNFLIYYAGHGTDDKKAAKAYWLPSDAERDDPSYWIIADEITTAIKVIPARHILVISDSCYSGGINRDISPDFTLQNRSHYLEKMMEGGSRTLMASGGFEPVSDEGSEGHSVFANALLKGLTTDSDLVFSAHQLFEQFIFNSVLGRSDQTPQYGAIRNAGQENDGDFVFVRASR